MTTQEMKDNVIRKYGFEHPATLYFFECCELPDADDFLNSISYEFAMNMEWPNE